MKPPSPVQTSHRREAADMAGGQKTGRYFVEEKLASGGMGIVYRVVDRTTLEPRALKRMKSEVAAKPYFVQAFQREYEVLASLRHPRIIRVFEYGVDETGPYYTMEFLGGQDLKEAAPLPYVKACLYLRDVATSLALLHARRLLHRDLSPTNVRLTNDDHCKLFDFGALAPFGYSQNVVVGTPSLVPPEALKSSVLDQRADLYSLGALAYWMLTRTHAFRARKIPDLFDVWREPPDPPSLRAPDIPKELDTLVLSLLSMDTRARPASAAEVIARLNVIAGLPPEGAEETAELARSFLASPRFTGREAELQRARELTDAAVRGSGAAVCIASTAGMGRTRLLQEIGVGAQLSGALLLHVDAGAHSSRYGSVRALALRLFDALPDVARASAAQFETSLAVLGPEVQERIGGPSASPAQDPPPQSASRTRDKNGSSGGTLEEWFVDISRTKPLVIEIDNLEYADDASLGFLAVLARGIDAHPVLLVTAERVTRELRSSMALDALRNCSSRMELAPFTLDETRELVRSLFADAPNAERFAEWLQGRSAGSPLHAIEISRQLIAQEVIRYTGGLWTIPDHRPNAELPAALGDALSLRLSSLSDGARALVDVLSLQRERPTFELCRLLSGAAERETLGILDELERSGVLQPDGDAYGFSSTALRDSVLASMDEARLEQTHRRLGEALVELAEQGNPSLRLDAGLHLIKGGDEERGADLIASVTYDAVTIRTLIANLHHAGAALEAALEVYGRHGRTVFERLPLLSALAQCGYYEERSWGDRYGDEALDVLEDASGLRRVRRLRRFFGRRLGLVFGILLAWVRFLATPRRERNYSFSQVMVHLFATVTTLAGAASLSFDSDRAERVAAVLEPFSFLPEKLTPVGIYQFCRGLGEIGRDNEAVAYDTFDKLLGRFRNPRYYPSLPADARELYIAACHFARGSFAVFRADGRGALESADGLDRVGFKLYAMIASQLRFLYHMNRGEFEIAAVHRDQVEVYAAQVGSIWQVETWEPAVLILVYNSVGDIVGSTRVAHRLELLSRTVPSLQRHARLAQNALEVNRHERRDIAPLAAEFESFAPRSFNGWGTTMSYLAREYNERGLHVKAKEVCERTLSHLNEGDREYVSHFLVLELELAVADAGLGRNNEALGHLDALLARFEPSGHPLAIGLIHETRARIAYGAGNVPEYERSFGQVERWFSPLGSPALIAKIERLAELRGISRRRAPDGALVPSTVQNPRSDLPRITKTIAGGGTS